MATGVLLALLGVAIFLRAGKLADRILGPGENGSGLTGSGIGASGASGAESGAGVGAGVGAEGVEAPSWENGFDGILEEGQVLR